MIDIFAITISVNYSGILENILSNSVFFNTWYIITTKEDVKTANIVENIPNIKLLFFDGFNANGAKFNKGGALKFAQDYIIETHGFKNILILDSDILLPQDFEKSLPDNLEEDVLYGTTERVDFWSLDDFKNNTNPHVYPSNITFVGFFQLFKQNIKYFYKFSNHCGNCDDLFRDNFPTKTFLNLSVKHLGRHSTHWEGRDTDIDQFHLYSKSEIPTKNHIFLLCFNEECIIRQTITHYKTRFPNAIITIIDNNSTDNSVKIAQEEGCDIFSFESENIMNEFIMRDIRNKHWKSVKNGWVIICDMDEWLNVCESELLEEDNKGTTVLTTVGYNMVGKSYSEKVEDIDLNSLEDGFYDKNFCKNACFKRPAIIEMNYNTGCHECKPKGIVKYSEKKYILKHMDRLGIPYLVRKMKARYARSKWFSEKFGLNGHYTDNMQKVYDNFMGALAKSGNIYSDFLNR
jgi:hypothetical protein